ncbi:MAG: cytochrome c [Pseudobdellovibrionaceae bacterium]|nr:cytochrome c [Bdellovibrionales bacterium]USN48203.1 MAG: cytochrome c [Pseudobdellovibrionaceae bacterium]
MRVIISLIIFSLAVLEFSVSEAAGDATQGEQKAQICAACHGAGGMSANPLWPNLAGQKDQYLLKQLKAFKSGERKDPLMSPQASTLTEKDMEDLAAYYSRISASGQ